MTKNITQIFLNGNNTYQLPEVITKQVNIVKDVYSDYTHTLYTNEMVADFLSDFDKETLNSYDMLKPFAFKADLARYCLLYKYGGWYFDISLYPEFKLEFDKNVPGALIYNHSRNLIENSSMYFKPNSEYLLESINQINFHILRKYYGIHPLEITGPGLLKRIYDRFDKEHFNNYVFGTYEDLSVKQYVSKYDNKIFVRAKFPQTVGLSHLKVKNTNIYDAMWYAKDVYKY